MAGRRRPSRNHAGAHYLRCPEVAAALVGSAGLDSGDLVLDLGAGAGVLSVRLAGTGARVIAIERDDRMANRLRRRFADDPRVRVVAGDILSVPLPNRGYHVVANPPFAITTALLRRLLDDPRSQLRGADVLVEWGAARRLAGAPRNRSSAWWSARFELRIRSRVPASCFRPQPSVDAAHLVIRPRAGVSAPRVRSGLRDLLRVAFRDPERPIGNVVAQLLPRAGAHRSIRMVGQDPHQPSGCLSGKDWADLAAAVAEERGRV